MKPAPSLAGRAFLAIALLVGFYALALTIAGILVYLPYAEWYFGGRIHARLALFGLGGAAIILWSLLPRVDRFTPPGPTLTAADHPRMFDLIRRVAAATQQQMPSDVYLVPDRTRGWRNAAA